MAGARTTGWKLDRHDREELLRRFDASYPEIVADHVTLQHNAPPEVPLPAPTQGEVVGWTDDGAGVQALVVAIDGSTDRPDGSTYHITWSLGPGRKAKESNHVIRQRGWTAIAEPIEIQLTPAEFG